MLLRQKVLVAMLREARNRASRVQLMKWAFLLSVETQSRPRNACYQFVPYHYGPYEYVHFPELGIPGQDRIELAKKEDYDRLFAKYAQTTLKDRVESIRRVAEIIETRPSTLVCVEADPACCHRHVLAQALSDRIDHPVVHLEWPR